MVSTKQRRAKKVDPFASVPGENGPARYNRLYAKARNEGYQAYTINAQITLAQKDTDHVHLMQKDFSTGEYACDCAYSCNEPGRICKHITLLYPPQPYRDPCPLCSGAMVHRQEGGDHAVRCLNCHYVEQWTDTPVSLYHGAVNDILPSLPASPPVLANPLDVDTVYQELYGKERA